KGDTTQHIELTLSRVRALLDSCGFVLPADADVARASEWLNTLRQSGKAIVLKPGQTDFTPSEVAELLDCSTANVRALVKRHQLAASGDGKARRLPRETVQTLIDRARAVEKLPSFLPSGKDGHEAEAIRATGTDGLATREVASGCSVVALPAAIQGHQQALRSIEGGDKRHSPETTQPPVLPGVGIAGHSLSSPVISEGDGTRTRNHRIDSPSGGYPHRPQQ